MYINWRRFWNRSSIQTRNFDDINSAKIYICTYVSLNFMVQSKMWLVPCRFALFGLNSAHNMSMTIRRSWRELKHWKVNESKTGNPNKVVFAKNIRTHIHVQKSGSNKFILMQMRTHLMRGSNFTQIFCPQQNQKTKKKRLIKRINRNKI